MKKYTLTVTGKENYTFQLLTAGEIDATNRSLVAEKYAVKEGSRASSAITDLILMGQYTCILN